MRGSNPRLLAHKTNTLPTELMELRQKKKKVGTMGIEPMTNGLLDQRSTDWAMRPVWLSANGVSVTLKLPKL